MLANCPDCHWEEVVPFARCLFLHRFFHGIWQEDATDGSWNLTRDVSRTDISQEKNISVNHPDWKMIFMPFPDPIFWGTDQALLLRGGNPKPAIDFGQQRSLRQSQLASWFSRFSSIWCSLLTPTPLFSKQTSHILDDFGIIFRTQLVKYLISFRSTLVNGRSTGTRNKKSNGLSMFKTTFSLWKLPQNGMQFHAPVVDKANGLSSVYLIYIYIYPRSHYSMYQPH